MNSKYIKVFEEINASIPQHLKERLMKKEPLTPVMKEIMLKGIQDESIDPKKRERWQHIIDAGYMDKEEEVVDEEVEKEIEEFISKEVERAKKLGKLPKRINKKYGIKAKRDARKNDKPSTGETD
jgi:hypothetical protein